MWNIKLSTTRTDYSQQTDKILPEKKKSRPLERSRLDWRVSQLATVAAAGLRSFAGLGSADLTAVGTLAWLAFDTTIFVWASHTAGAAMREDLSG
jgi:hypothetical protein